MKPFINTKIVHSLYLLLTAFVTILAFQNCSGGFQTKNLAANGFNTSGSVVETPQIAFTQDIPAMTSAASLTTSFTVTPANQIQSVTCQLNSNPAQDCSALTMTYSNLADGDYVLVVSATNKSGSKSQLSRIFRKDSIAPVVAFSLAPAASTSLQSTNISFTAMDNLSGVKNIECALDTAAFATCTSPVSLSNLSVGNHTFKIRATDNAGNLSSVSSTSWSIDLSASAVTISQMPAAVTNSLTASFAFSGSGLVSYECSLDNAAFASCSSPKSYSALSSAAHNFQVRGANAAAVVSAATKYSWTVDTILPAAPALTSSISALTNLRDASISFSSTDASGITSYQCMVDAIAFAACSSPKMLSALADGSHTIKVKAVDNAGNISSESSLTWVVDATAPALTFTQPPAASSTSTSASIAFTAADSGSGLNLLQCSLDNVAFANCTSPVSLTNLAVASHSFRVQAQDKAGNSNMIAVTFVVTSTTSPPPTTGEIVTNWVTVASEGGPTGGTFTANGTARYGHGLNWVTKTLNGTFSCSGATFGNPTDPAPGLYKDCQIMLSAPNVVQTGKAPVINIPLMNPPAKGFAEEHVANNGGFDVGPFDIGAFRTNCAFSHFGFNDPIVFPGQAGLSHLHMFFGNTGADANSTADSLLNSGNSTCSGGTVNRTGYWVPAMVNLKIGAPIIPEGTIWYYKGGYLGVKSEDVVPFPQGLRMIAGDSKAVGPPADQNGHIRISCGNNDGTFGNVIPNCAVGDEMDIGIMFPQCWDGKNLDSPDHKSHMAYGTGNGCPSTHPIGLPEVSLNFHYLVTEERPDLNWKLSSDNYVGQGGYSMHADWFGAWKPEILKTFVENCINKKASSSNALCDGRGLSD